MPSLTVVTDRLYFTVPTMSAKCTSKKKFNSSITEYDYESLKDYIPAQ